MKVERKSRAKRAWAIGGALAIAGGAYLAARLRNGWFPWDEGSLAITAERVLLGGIPHRDFPDLYTGGLTYLNAAAFRVLGIDLLSPRIVLLLFFVAWLVILYQLAARFLPLWLSAMVVALSIVWSVPNYPAAIPSWYNLFFATAGLLAVVVFSDGSRLGWIWLAGVCAGLSICAKIVGVFFVLGIGAFLIFYEQTRSDREPARSSGKAYSALVGLFAIGVILALSQLVFRTGSASQFFRFVLPMGALVSVLVVEEWGCSRSAVAFGPRLASLLVPALTFLFGMAIPLAILSLPYVLSGTITELINGVFISPASRLEYAARPVPPMRTAVPTLAVAAVLLLGLRLRPANRRFHHVLLLASGGAILLAARDTWGAYMFVWFSAFHLTPLLIVAGCAWVAFAKAPDRDRRRLFALLSATAGVGLVEFPYTSSNYFLYTAPLVFLTLAALVWEIGKGRIQVAAIGIPWAFYFAFGLLLMNAQPPGSGGPQLREYRWAELSLPRARLRSSPTDSLIYGQLMQVLQAHADRELGYAGPDSPEVYFLAGFAGGAPVLFDFLHEGSVSPLDDPEFLGSSDLIVLNLDPEFSAGLRQETLERLATRFPQSEVVGHFEVRWRE